MGFIGNLFKLGIVGLLLSWAALYFRYSGEKIAAKVYSLPSPPKFIEALKPNDILARKTSYILKDKISGPESLVVEGDDIYTTLYDGRVVRINGGKIVKEVRFTKEKNCGNFDSESRCGRPLGIRRLNSKEFVVADAYLGIYTADFEKGTHRQLLSSKVSLKGHAPRFLNDVEVLNEDEIVFTDSSWNWDRRHFMNVVLSMAGDARVIKHKISTKETTVLASGLNFANGIQLLSDKKTLLVAECAMARINKIDLATGKMSPFAENLPGLPDNIRRTEDGTLWVGLAGIRRAGQFSFVDALGPYNTLRQILVDLVPGKFWLWFFPKVKPPHALIVQLNEKGQIIGSLHDQQGTMIEDVSQVTSSGKVLYLGSYHSAFIGRVDL